MRIALIGNPNAGKTTLFNRLTGLHQHVANWPGSTVEYARGTARFGGRALELTDLPGVYGLTAHAESERVTRQHLLYQPPDAVLLVLDASSLERSLFLALETLELCPRAVIALNKLDIARARGVAIDLPALAERLGVAVVPIVASRGEGLAALLEAVVAAGSAPIAVRVEPRYQPDLEAAVGAVAARVSAAPSLIADPRWVALRLLQGDTEVLDRPLVPAANGKPGPGLASCHGGSSSVLTVSTSEPRLAGLAAGYLDGLATRTDEFALAIAEARYARIQELLGSCVRSTRPVGRDWSAQIDALALHPLGGPLLLALIFGIMFWASFQASAPLSAAVAAAVEWTTETLRAGLDALAAPDWLASLLLDGVLAGVGAVIAYVPYMALFFAAMTLLEASGFMARAALLGDRLMQAIGLHGRSLFSLVNAFGCNVPALMATRGMDSGRARLVTALVIPFVPCNARLGVMAIMAGAFFRDGTAGLVLLALVLISVLVVGLAALAYGRALPAAPTPLLLELPPYSLPRWQDVALPALHHSFLFVRRIWRFLVPATAVVWALSSLPLGAEPESSYAALLGGWLALLGEPFGFDWRLMVAIVFGFVAKETTLGTLGVLFGLSDDGPLADAFASAFSPLVGFTFLVVYMLYVPCLATVVQLRRELGGWRWAALGAVVTIVVAFAIGLLVNQLGQLLGAA